MQQKRESIFEYNVFKKGGDFMSSYTESQIAAVVLDCIKSKPGITTTELIAEARQIMKPSGDDLEQLDNRNDDKFSQKVRNIKSHDSIAHLVRTEGDRNRRWYLK